MILEGLHDNVRDFIIAIDNIRSTIVSVFTDKNMDKEELLKRTIIFIVIFFLFTYPILHANVYYDDDHFRSMTGTNAFKASGRPLAGVILAIISLHHWDLFDAAPLPQIFGILILSVTFSILSFGLNKIPRRDAIVIFSLLVCNYFFLQDISYRFDSLTISLALSLSLIPFYFTALFYGQTFIISLVCVFLTLNLYQPAITSFLVFSVMLFIYNVPAKNLINDFYLLASRLSAAIVSTAIFKIEMLFVTPVGYGKLHSATSFSFYLFFQNFISFFRYIFRNADATHQVFIYTFSFVLMFVGIILYEFSALLKKRGHLNSSIVVFISLSAMILCAFGPMLFLKSPVLQPRIMIGVNVLFASTYILFLQRCGAIMKNISRFVVIFVLFSQFSISYADGNALRLTSISERYMANNISENISMISRGGKPTVLIEGLAPEIPAVRNIKRQLPIIKTLSPDYLNGPGPGNRWELPFWELGGKFHVVDKKNTAAKINKRIATEKADARINTPLYTMTRYHNIITVRFSR